MSHLRVVSASSTFEPLPFEPPPLPQVPMVPPIPQPSQPMGVSFTTNRTAPYPCDRGTGIPMGYHDYHAAPGGAPVCRLCGHTR